MALLTISAAARLCHVDRRTLQRAIHAGRLHLDAQHCLSTDELVLTGYLIPETSQAALQDTPQDMPPRTPHYTPRHTPQEPPLLPLLERLAVAIESLCQQVEHLQQAMQHAPQSTPQDTPQKVRRRRVSSPRHTPQEPPQSTPHEAPRDMPHQAPQSAPQLLSAYDQEAAVARMQALRREGLSFTRIADQLTAEGVPTRYGLPWQHSSVRYLLRTWMVGGGLWSETRVSRHNTLLSLPASCRRGNGVVRRNQRKDPYAHL
jgi:hypothetical protein